MSMLRLPAESRLNARLGLVMVLVTLAASGSAVPAQAAPNGSLDLTFDTDGKVTTAIGSGNDRAIAIAIQTDGKIVAVGHSAQALTGDDFALARYNTDGSLDPTFGTGGKVTTAIGPAFDQAYSVAIQPDGKIVVGGVSYVGGVTDTFADFALARYNTDGSLDTTFDTDGMLTTAFNTSTEWANWVVLQTDGKIVAGGLSRASGGDFYNFALVRYNADGSLDTTFDTDGKLTTDFAGLNDRASKVAMQTDGKIVAVGVSSQGGNNDFAVVRYNTDGSLDTTFDTDGKVTTAIGFGNDDARAMAIQTDGKIVAGGISFQANNDFGLVRYNTDGSLDTTFDTDGKLATDVASASDDARSIAIQTNGKLVVGGISNNGSNDDFGLVRYNTDGSLDTAFDTDGKITTPIGPGADGAISVAIQADGRIVAGGHSNNGTDDDFALARYATQELSVTKLGTGTGTVTSDLAGINCGGACSDTYNNGASVTLTATPDAGSYFPGWSGDCSGASTCTLSMTAARAVTATFDVQPPPPPPPSPTPSERPTFTLTVMHEGTGSGTVTTSNAGTDCGAGCSTHSDGAAIMLTASPMEDSTFGSWSGCDSDADGHCSIMMSEDRIVTVSFDAAPETDTCGGLTPTIRVAGPNLSTYGTTEIDVIVGTTGNDTIYGLDLADVICGLGGDDKLYGGGGNDGGKWGDRLFGGAGQDRLAGDGGDDSLVGGSGNDRLYGNVGNDALSGNGGDDRLTGNDGRDTCNGGPGKNDTSRSCETSRNFP